MFDSNKSNAISWFFFGCFYVLRQTVLTKQPRKKNRDTNQVSNSNEKIKQKERLCFKQKKIHSRIRVNHNNCVNFKTLALFAV